MAKSKEFSLEDFLDEVKEKPLIDVQEDSSIEDWISTGNYALNAQLTASIYKGIPVGRLTHIAGESGTGKTYLCLNTAREAQKKGYFVFYIDTEGALDLEMVKKFGVDPSMISLKDFDNIIDAKQFISQRFDVLSKKKKEGATLPKIMLVIDSITNFMTFKEVNDSMSGSEKKDMTAAAERKALLRLIASKAKQLKIPIITTGHTYANIGSFIPGQTQAGGSGLEYLPSIRLMLSKAQMKEGDERTGIIVTSKVPKNRFARPLPIKFHISFIKGMNQYVGLQNEVTYEEHGIGSGKYKKVEILEPVLDDEGNPIMHRGKPKMNVVGTEFEYVADESGKTWAVKHLGKEVKASDLFTKEVFTSEILDSIDQKLQTKYAYPSYDDLDAELDLEVDEETGEIL